MSRAALEQLSSAITASELRDICPLVDATLAGIGRASDAAQRALVTTLFLRTCGTIVDTLHARPPAAVCECRAWCWSSLPSFLDTADRDPREAFRAWADGFVSVFEHGHPPTAAMRAAAIVRADPAGNWTVDVLARRVGMGRRRLRDGFHHELGMTPSAYVQLARVTRAVALFRTAAKVEAVAWDVGYKSKKDLYAALSRWVGATPGELRDLADGERDWLERQLRLRSLQGTARPIVAAAPESSGKSACHRQPPPRRQVPRPRM